MTVERTRSTSFEDSFNRKALTQGRLLVNQLAILLKVAQMHDLKNEAVVKAAESLALSAKAFFEDRKSFSLTLIGEYLFIEDVRVKYNVEDFNNFEFLVTEFKKRKLGAVTFNTMLEPSEPITFASIFLSADLGVEDVYQEIARRLGASGVAGVSTEELKPPKAQDEFEKVVDAGRAATRAYVRVVIRVKELFEGIDKGQPADIRKLKRAVQSLVDSVYKGEPTLLRLSAIRRREDLLPRHYVNVCLLSLAIGKRLGLSKYQMARLGMAALLHDVGRQVLPEDLAEHFSDMDETALSLIKAHPRLGVQTILRLKGLNEVAVSAMIVAYEHHRNLDRSGYPEQIEEKEMSLFSRIVRVADNYDASTSSGIYGQVALPPEKALGVMAKRSGAYYDPELLSVFVRLMGVYPVGSFLLLSDGTPAVVVAPHGSKDTPDRPVVRLIGHAGAAGEEVDLGLREPSGVYRREVSRSLDPYQYRINIYRYLI